MRAQALVQLVCESEKELQVEIADIVQKKINKLSKQTGLIVDGVSISLVEITNMDDEQRQWLVGHISIIAACQIKYSQADVKVMI